MLHHRHYLDKKAAEYLSDALVRHFARNPAYDEIAIVCVGTNSYSWDSLGPLIGSRLAEVFGAHDQSRVRIIGTMNKPVHALNLNKCAASLASARSDQRVYAIAVDACLGQYYKIGTLQFVEEPLEPGSVLGKKLQAVGHVHFKGVVNNYSALNMKVLEHTSLTFIEEMADVLAETLTRGIRLIEPLLRTAPASDAFKQSKANLLNLG